MTSRNRSVRRPLVPALCLLAVVGCSDGGDDGVTPTAISALPEEGGAPPTNTGGSAPDETEAPAFATLDGDWLRACGATDPTDPDTRFDVLVLNVSGTVATQRELSYEDGACRVPASPAELSGTLSFTLPGGTVETSLGTAAHLDRAIRSVAIDGVVPNAALQQQLESAGAFDTVHDIVLIGGSELYFGDTEGDSDRDGTTPARRPDTLDPRPYVRQ